MIPAIWSLFLVMLGVLIIKIRGIEPVFEMDEPEKYMSKMMARFRGYTS